MKATLIFASFMLLTGCQSAVPDQAALAILLNTPPDPHLAFCLSISGKDPSPAVLSALQKTKWRVVPASTCLDVQFGVVTPNRLRAERVGIDGFHRVVPWRATAEFWTQSSPLSGRSWRIKLKRVGDAWVVESTELVSMS